MSDHEKVYGVCENKCFVEVLPKEQAATKDDIKDVKKEQFELYQERTVEPQMTRGFTTNDEYYTIPYFPEFRPLRVVEDSIDYKVFELKLCRVKDVSNNTHFVISEPYDHDIFETYSDDENFSIHITNTSDSNSKHYKVYGIKLEEY